MNAWFAAIRVGDACSTEGVDYRVAGVLAFLQPDSSFWTEWLLVPEGETSARALDSHSARWLGWEEDIGALLWTPIDVPAGVVPAAIDGLQKLEHRGRVYRRMERDSYVVSRVQGRADANSRTGERFDYLEMLAGSDRLDFEWNAGGLSACEGRRVRATEVRDWFLLRGVRLEARAASATAVRRARAVETPKRRHRLPDEVWGWVLGLLVAIPVILLESCSPRCTERFNAQTQQTEYVCSDGTVRNSRPWFGK